MSQIDTAVDTLNGLDTWMQWSFGFVTTLFVVGFVRLLMQKVLLDFVKKTPFQWDDKLYSPVTKRIYTFILVTGALLTMTCILGEDHSLVVSA
ncbi:MAG: hypothetical protein HOE79_05260, partial [Euryarchaeota archaeon]|nr:hypothetical protein [Euryarchaeota archaeon]